MFEDSRWREDKDLWKNVQKADWEDVILDSGMKESLKHEYRSFFKSEKVYKVGDGSGAAAILAHRREGLRHQGCPKNRTHRISESRGNEGSSSWA